MFTEGASALLVRSGKPERDRRMQERSEHERRHSSRLRSSATKAGLRRRDSATARPARFIERSKSQPVVS